VWPSTGDGTRKGFGQVVASPAVTTAVSYDKPFPPGYDRHTTGSLMESLSVEMVEATVLALARRTA